MFYEAVIILIDIFHASFPRPNRYLDSKSTL
ncbi:uncharacterized protein METZ01_LOCUS433162 [marine metagenome]|uniref:Uncharacterized protein n=1 Tax=marine metagenome TaxID=408172 RepID=A0A382YCR4_9ZZZZ